MTNLEKRTKAVAAMEYLVRQVNDEALFDLWLSDGVADGEILYGDLTGATVDEYWTEDEENFGDLCRLFLLIMARAYRDGGLYCGGVASGDKTTG